MKMRSYAASAMALMLCACVTTPQVNTNDQVSVSQQIKIHRDDFEKITTYMGPNVATSDPGYDFVFLRAFKKDGVPVHLYQIYVDDYYRGEWRFYDSAYDSNGNSLDTIQIDRRTRVCSNNICSHEEQIGINVSSKYLESNQTSGIRFKISGKRGEEIFFIPPGYIKGFLSQVK